MDISLLLAFCSSTFLLALMPGPDNLYVLTESISKGWRQGVGITAGLVSGVLVHTTLVATGFSLLIFQYDWSFQLVKYAGAIYLAYLVYGALKEVAADVDIGQQGQPSKFFPLLRQGFFMNVLNPKVALFFIAFLPQFVTDSNWPPFNQIIIFGCLFMLISFFVFSGIALTAGSAAHLIQRKRFWKVTKWVKVIVLCALIILLITQSV